MDDQYVKHFELYNAISGFLGDDAESPDEPLAELALEGIVEGARAVLTCPPSGDAALLKALEAFERRKAATVGDMRRLHDLLRPYWQALDSWLPRMPKSHAMLEWLIDREMAKLGMVGSFPAYMFHKRDCIWIASFSKTTLVTDLGTDQAQVSIALYGKSVSFAIHKRLGLLPNLPASELLDMLNKNGKVPRLERTFITHLLGVKLEADAELGPSHVPYVLEFVAFVARFCTQKKVTKEEAKRYLALPLHTRSQVMRLLGIAVPATIGVAVAATLAFALLMWLMFGVIGNPPHETFFASLPISAALCGGIMGTFFGCVLFFSALYRR